MQPQAVQSNPAHSISLTLKILSDVWSQSTSSRCREETPFRQAMADKEIQNFRPPYAGRDVLMKKADIVHAIKPIPRDVRDHLNNLMRCGMALAHSFFPENRRENRKTKKVLYAGVDIFTYEGVERFEDDWHPAFTKLAKRVYIG